MLCQVIKVITWGAIVTRRLQNNSRRGDFFGGIYATRVANYLGIAPREGDMILPLVYLDKEAMFNHHFLERNEQFLHYRLIYDRRNVVPVTLPAPYLFDYQAKGRYVITREEAEEYEGESGGSSTPHCSSAGDNRCTSV